MRNLLYIIAILIVTGCSYADRNTGRCLEEAAALLQTDPNAAMQRLNGYDIAEFDDSSTMARWALLYSEALVANNIKVPTDTIVNIAIDYYRSHKLADEFKHAARLKALLNDTTSEDALAEALYLQKEKEFMLYKERVKRQRYIFYGVLFLLAALGIIIWQRQRLRFKEAQNEALMAQASSLMDGLSRKESLCSDLQCKLSGILSTRFASIDALCETYFESQGTKTERKAIAGKVKSQIDELKSDTGMFAEMEQCVNDCRDGLLDKLRMEFPAIKPDDYRLMVFLASNLSNRSIAALLGESIDVVYKRKSRLKSRIAALGTRSMALFLSVF